jgi:hypothetical protein
MLATQTIMQIICYWSQMWTHSVDIVRMLRYSVDEENVGGKKLKPGSKRKLSDSARKRNNKKQRILS